MSKVADSIRRGLKEAVAYAEGKADESAYRIHVPEKIDVKAIRTRLDMTQEEFAGRLDSASIRCAIGNKDRGSRKGRPEPIFWLSSTHPRQSRRLCSPSDAWRAFWMPPLEPPSGRCLQSWPQKFEQVDRWKICLGAAKK